MKSDGDNNHTQRFRDNVVVIVIRARVRLNAEIDTDNHGVTCSNEILTEIRPATSMIAVELPGECLCCHLRRLELISRRKTWGQWEIHVTTYKMFDPVTDAIVLNRTRFCRSRSSGMHRAEYCTKHLCVIQEVSGDLGRFLLKMCVSRR